MATWTPVGFSKKTSATVCEAEALRVGIGGLGVGLGSGDGLTV